MPYVTAEGAWHVTCNDGTELVYYVGLEERVCTYWSEAWDVQAVRPARTAPSSQKAGSVDDEPAARSRRRKVAS